MSLPGNQKKLCPAQNEHLTSFLVKSITSKMMGRRRDGGEAKTINQKHFQYAEKPDERTKFVELEKSHSIGRKIEGENSHAMPENRSI